MGTKLRIAGGPQFTAILDQLEQAVSEAVPRSLMANIIRMITQRNSKAKSSLFPSSCLYSFKQSDLWLSLTLLPSSETTTQVRYDIFNSSPNVIINKDDLVTVVDEMIENLISVLEAEYQAINDRPVENFPYICKILQTIQKHSKLERIHGEQVLPAMHKPKGSNLFQQAEQCKSPRMC
jgi:hypothetical protein